MSARSDLRRHADPRKAEFHRRFFKTGKGEYAEGDRFIGVVVPKIRLVARAHWRIPLPEVGALLKSPIHEERALALLILVRKFRKATPEEKKRIFTLYCKLRRYVNNWDLVDCSAEHVLGGYLVDKPRGILHKWSRSRNLWERRLSIMATFHFIRAGEFAETLALAEKLLRDEHDLIHKAVGWMLREIGNRSPAVEERFLKKHYKRMPRTMLRYAIEKFPEKRRRAYLRGLV